MSKTKTIEQWLDARAPKWVQNAYREQMRQILDRLEVAEGRTLTHDGDQVVEYAVGPGETQSMHSCDGFPVPEKITNDPTSVEILRVWLHHDGEECAHAIAPYALDGPNAWGLLLGTIADRLISSEDIGTDARNTMMMALIRGFAVSIGIPIVPVRVGSHMHVQREDDPDDLPN